MPGGVAWEDISEWTGFLFLGRMWSGRVRKGGVTPSPPASSAQGPAVAAASPVRLCRLAKEKDSGKALEKRNRRGHAGPGCVGPEVEVAAAAETGHPAQRKALSLLSLRVVARERRAHVGLQFVGHGGWVPPSDTLREELSPPLVKPGLCQEVGDEGARGRGLLPGGPSRPGSPQRPLLLPPLLPPPRCHLSPAFVV